MELGRHYLFHVLGIKPRAKVCVHWRNFKTPGSLLLTVLKWRFWCNFYFMLIGVGVSCCIWHSVVSYLYVSFNRLITSVGEEGANFSAIDYS